MRRAIILSALIGVTGLASLGCKNAVRGRCDCMYDPANTQLVAPSNPYPTVGAAVTAPAKVVPAPAPGGTTVPDPVPPKPKN